jgi:hypothetical protein
MAVVAGTVHSVHTLKSDAVTPLQIAEILFTVSGTYAQADNGILSGVAALIQNSRRNGKTVSLVGVMLSQTASQAADLTKFLSLKTVAIATADVTFEITDNHYSTEFADATALVAQSRPFGIAVSFTEA